MASPEILDWEYVEDTSKMYLVTIVNIYTQERFTRKIRAWTRDQAIADTARCMHNPDNWAWESCTVDPI